VLVQRGWHYILLIIVLGYSSSFAKQASGLFWQASNCQFGLSQEGCTSRCWSTRTLRRSRRCSWPSYRSTIAIKNTLNYMS